MSPMPDTLIPHPDYVRRFADMYGRAELGLGAVVPTVGRWIGRCKGCKSAVRVEGVVRELVGPSARARAMFAVVGADGLARVSSCYGDYEVVGAACACGKWTSLRLVVDGGKSDAARHKCGGICRNAKGPNCDCACRGANHGAG